LDPEGLIILLKELEVDSAVARDAAEKAEQRFSESSSGRLEACAYELGRCYNVFERMLERICEQFENHFEKRGDFHEKLLQRLALPLEGIRPAFIPRERLTDIRELKGFRHVMRHAYDLTLREDRLAELVSIAKSLGDDLPVWSADFGNQVRTEQKWPKS